MDFDIPHIGHRQNNVAAHFQTLGSSTGLPDGLFSDQKFQFG
jgi:hypothetical protein